MQGLVSGPSQRGSSVADPKIFSHAATNVKAEPEVTLQLVTSSTVMPVHCVAYSYAAVGAGSRASCG